MEPIEYERMWWKKKPYKKELKENKTLSRVSHITVTQNYRNLITYKFLSSWFQISASFPDIHEWHLVFVTFEIQDFFFNFKNNKHFYLIRPHCADGNWVKGGLLVVLEEWRGWQTWWRCGDTPRVLHMYLFLNVLPPLPSLNNTASYISTNLSLLFMPSPTCRGFTASCGVEYLEKWVFRNMDFINITID